MSTFMAKMGSTQRKWYVVDAAGKQIGRASCRERVLRLV